MRLSARVITNWANANQFDYGNQWNVRAGDPNTLYFQLVDLDQDSLRYIPGIDVSQQPISVVVTFPSIDDTQVINVTAIQDPNDRSIFRAVMGPNQKPNSGNVRFAVTEGSATRRFSALNLLSVEYPDSDGSC